MKDGVGKGFTREDHYDVSNQLFASYSKVQDARSLASVIGEDELSELDKQYLPSATPSSASLSTRAWWKTAPLRRRWTWGGSC